MKFLPRFRLRTRLTFLLALAVCISLILSMVLNRHVVWHPVAQAIMRADLSQAIYVAEEIERGTDPESIRKRLGLELKLLSRLRMRRRFSRCHEREVRGRRALFCRKPGRGFRLVIQLRTESSSNLFSRSRKRWLVIDRVFDLDAFMHRITFVLLTVAAVVVGLAALIAGKVTQPLKASIEAMERMARGDLRHRLPDSGPPEVREVGRAFNRMAEQISILLEAERSLMAGISHELRTPLTRLRLHLEILRQHAVPSDRLTAMEADIDDINHLVGEVIEASRLSIGQKPLSVMDIDLNLVVEEALGHDPLPHHEVSLVGQSTPLQGDHHRLVRVVTNLLNNAGKYAPLDSKVTITIRNRTITIADEGPGVTESELLRLFEPFYRTPRERRSTTTGLGLGLMIARQIVELHGGSIEAKNRPSGGLAVSFTLPETPPTGD